MKPLKWSHSLDNSVRSCSRKAFLVGRYANPNTSDGKPRREAFLVNQAADVARWRGNLIHLVIEKCLLPALKKGENPKFEATQRWLYALIDSQAKFSGAGKYRIYSKERAGISYCILRSDLLGSGTTAAEIEEVKETSVIALNNLRDKFSELFERIKIANKFEVEKPIRIKLDDRIRIEAIPDLIIEESQKITIVDWKAGLNFSAHAREQLYVYAYAVFFSGWWESITIENIELLEANLMTGDLFSYPVDEDNLSDVDNRIFTGSQLLEPIYEKPVDELSFTDFASAQSPGTCEWCTIKEICNGKILPQSKAKQCSLFELV